MHLAFGGASPNRRPSHQIGDVLRRRRVEELTSCGDAEVGDIAQQPTCNPQAAIDVKAAVETGIIDQPLPADGRARLFEIDTHDDLQSIVEPVAHIFQPLRIVEGGNGIMHRTRPDNDDKAILVSLQDPMHGQARSRNGIGSSARLGVLTDHRRRRAQLVQR